MTKSLKIENERDWKFNEKIEIEIVSLKLEISNIKQLSLAKFNEELIIELVPQISKYVQCYTKKTKIGTIKQYNGPVKTDTNRNTL